MLAVKNSARSSLSHTVIPGMYNLSNSFHILQGEYTFRYQNGKDEKKAKRKKTKRKKSEEAVGSLFAS